MASWYKVITACLLIEVTNFFKKIATTTMIFSYLQKSQFLPVSPTVGLNVKCYEI